MKRSLFFLSFGVILVFSVSILSGGSGESAKQQEEKTAEEPTYSVPQGVPRWILVFSNLEKHSMVPILQFINKSTGLNCKLSEDSGTNISPGGEYDIYLGVQLNEKSGKIYNYQSDSWNKADAEYHKRGVYTWSKWYSCLAVNRAIEEDFSIYQHDVLESLKGKTSMVDPSTDVVTLCIIDTLYRSYGREFLVDLNSSVPVYRKTGEELVFTIESGLYSSAIGIAGYFTESIITGYPIGIFFESYKMNKYPVTTVLGTNVAYIPDTSSNREGSGYLIDFLASSLFQEFLLNTYYFPVFETEAYGEPGSLFPEEPENVLPAESDLSSMEQVLAVWKEILYPEGVKDIVE
jgi:ABC-type Fe3+ transport system substrate-binding protein